MKKGIVVLLVISLTSIAFQASIDADREHRKFPLQVLANPESLVEHPERENDTLPEGTIIAIDTTNPYKQWYNGDPLNEWHIDESYKDKPAWRKLNIVLALDEEAVEKWGIDYAVRTVERADEAFIAHYYLDFRIRAVVTWHSDDSIEWFYDELYWDAFEKLSQYLGNYVNGYEIDVVIALTGQETWDSNIYGLAPSFAIMGDNTLTLVRFAIYWADDNIVQHEMSHMYNTNDHPEEEDVFCVMAYCTDYIAFLIEDGKIYDMFCNIRRALRAYDWCKRCDPYLHCSGGSPGGYHHFHALLV